MSERMKERNIREDEREKDAGNISLGCSAVIVVHVQIDLRAFDPS